MQFARIMRDQLQASGLMPANYIGQGGLYPRSDLAGLNLAQYPSILVELGNMKNPADSALIEDTRRPAEVRRRRRSGHRRVPRRPPRRPQF